MPRADPAAAARASTAAVAAGDSAAFGAFYDAWFDAVYSLARAVSRRDEAWCLDVVQDVMLKVSRSLPVLDTDAAVSAWLSRAVVTTVIDRRRSERRRLRREQHNAAARAAIELPAELPAALAAGERTRWLRAQLAGLPAAERELVEARFLAGGSVTATAAALGMTADAAHGRLRRCLQRLRRAAADWMGG
ncbi:MAG: RNA polymerase sigma factor [Planctomycetota bacterium]